jgi:predicted DNA-binding transcriptional regulator AlpA
MEKLLTLAEIAEALKISLRQLQNIRKNSRFPAPVVLGERKVTYRESDIDEFIKNGGIA